MRHETVVVETGDQHGETLITDLCVHGVWLPQAEAFFDVPLILIPSQIYAILPEEFC